MVEHARMPSDISDAPAAYPAPDPERLTLYGSFTSSSTFKAMLFLRLAGLPFDFRNVNLKKGWQFTPAYRAQVNRYGKVPVLQHRGLTVVDSNVILDYLARATGRFEPADAQARWQAREWLAWEAGALTAVAKVRHATRFRAVHPEVMAHLRPEAEAALDVIDGALDGRDWLTGGAASIADLGCWGRMVLMAEGGLEIARWPNLVRWSEAIQAMPNYAHPYELTPKKDRSFAEAAAV